MVIVSPTTDKVASVEQLSQINISILVILHDYTIRITIAPLEIVVPVWRYPSIYNAFALTLITI
jgi:hypothetical protein